MLAGHNHLAHGWCYGDSCIFHEPLTGKAMVNQEDRLNGYGDPPNEACHWGGGGASCDFEENTRLYCSGEFGQMVKTWSFKNH